MARVLQVYMLEIDRTLKVAHHALIFNFASENIAGGGSLQSQSGRRVPTGGCNNVSLGQSSKHWYRDFTLPLATSNLPYFVFSVKFIGVCSKSSTNLCLISEYCCYGSLQGMLRGDKALPSIPHKTLVGIARDAAAGTLYLFFPCGTYVNPVIN